MWSDSILSEVARKNKKSRRSRRSYTLGTLWHVLPFLFLVNASDISKRKELEEIWRHIASEIRRLHRKKKSFQNRKHSYKARKEEDIIISKESLVLTLTISSIRGHTADVYIQVATYCVSAQLKIPRFRFLKRPINNSFFLLQMILFENSNHEENSTALGCILSSVIL